jgi:hypothetical protein
MADTLPSLAATRPRRAIVARTATAIELTPEFTLLAAAVACAISPDRAGAVRAASLAPVDWSLVAALAERHRIPGLLRRGLAEAGVEPPAAEFAALAARADRIAMSELFLAGEVVRLQGRFEAAGLRPLVVKGVAVAMAAFGQLGLRLNRDIDLLVAPDQVASGAAVLEAAGYKRKEPSAEASSGAVAAWIRTHKDMVFVHPSHRTIVELHWRLFDNRHLYAPPTGEPARVALSERAAVWTLPPEPAFLYLCLHGAEHAWSRLKWLADVAALAVQIEEAELARRYAAAKARGLHRAMAQALLLAERLFGFPAPSAVRLDAEADARLRWLVGVGLRCMTDGGPAELESRAFGTTLKNLSHYVLAGGLRYWLSEAVFDLTDVSGADLPPALRAAGPFARPAAWIWRRAAARKAGGA